MAELARWRGKRMRFRNKENTMPQAAAKPCGGQALATT
jgi:hypothetical protein